MALLRAVGRCVADLRAHHGDGPGNQAGAAEYSPACQLDALEQCRPLPVPDQMDSLAAWAHLDQPAAALDTGRRDMRWRQWLELARQCLLRPAQRSAVPKHWRPSSGACAGVCVAVDGLWIAKRWPSRRVACGASVVAPCPVGAWTESGCAQLQEKAPKTRRRRQRPRPQELQRHSQTARHWHWHSHLQIGSSMPPSFRVIAAPILPELQLDGLLLALPAKLRLAVLQAPLELGTAIAIATARTRTRSPRPLPERHQVQPAALARGLLV
mmetsp:Transcript_55236/g.101376  ORF Transcript_55236/g.101376 Transcript_55236/m.101376 type:complete len:269 (-) Transcript_55236:549-1355(-)